MSLPPAGRDLSPRGATSPVPDCRKRSAFPDARQTAPPVFGLTGVPDPIVPWPWVRYWLKKNCPALRDYRLIWSGDHKYPQHHAARSDQTGFGVDEPAIATTHHRG